jgi:hypothetical protein
MSGSGDQGWLPVVAAIVAAPLSVSLCQARTAMLQLVKTIALVCLVAMHVSAAEWKTTDGNISVAAPDESRFVQADVTPPLSVIWVSTDETIKLGVAEVPFRPDMKLIQASVEKGFAEGLGGRIVDSSTEQQAGHEIFVMTGHGEALGTEVYITQAVVAVGDKVYKIMAIGLGKDIRVNSDATKFLSSFRILTTKQAVTSDPQRSVSSPQPAHGDSDRSPVDLLSEKIGSISLLILIACAIVIQVSRSAKRQ